MSTILKDEIYKFVSSLPEWQRILASYLLQITDKEIQKEEAVQLSYETLLFENKLGPAPTQAISSILPEQSAESESPSGLKYRFVAVSEVQNLNALSPAQRLPVAETGLTVIYGENGVGKSGYGRLFNNVFYSRGDNFLIGNVFGPVKNQPCSAQFEFLDKDGNQLKLKYPENKNHPAFRQFASFDSKSVNVHIDNQNELHVQPRELDFFENLIQLIGQVSDKIDSVAKTHKSENQFSKFFIEESSIKTAVSKIDSKSDLEKIKSACVLSEDDLTKISELELKKSSLNLTTLEKTKKNLQNVKAKVTGLKQKLATAESSFTEEKIEFISKAIARYEDLKAEVARNGVDQFNNPKFKGIGSELWQQFIKGGKDLSALDQSSASPENGKACPYCRQDLTNEAVELIEKYNQFLESQARDNLKKAHDWGTKYSEGLAKVEVSKILDEDAFSVWAREKQSENYSKIVSSFADLEALKKDVTNAIKDWDKSSLKSFTPQIIDWASIESTLDQELLELNEEKIKIELKSVSEQLTTLNHKRVLSGLITEIAKFISDSRYAEELDKVKRQIGRTTTITNTSTELHERYISNRYIQLFKQECIDLNIPCPDLNPVGAKGKTKRKYSIVGEQPSKVLSEGEQRAVALADFFTEAQISDLGGLIFDDPVNSQDYKRKAKIAQRLATEARNRQVVVFTHDLLFLNDLVMATDDQAVVLTCHWMSKNSATETGIIFSNTVPDTEKAFIDAKIAKDRLAEAKGASNPLEAFRATKDGIGALRASYEAFIVRVVFDGIVERFSRRVRQSEIHKVHAPKESLYFISNKLGELSGYITGHLQVDSSTSEIDHALLEKEIGVYEQFSAGFKKEKIEALKNFKEANA